MAEKNTEKNTEKDIEKNTEKDAKREARRAARAAKKQARAERRAARKAESEANGGGVAERIKQMFLFIGKLLRWTVWAFICGVTYVLIISIFVPFIEQVLDSLANNNLVEPANLSIIYLVSIGGMSGAAVFSVPAMFKLLEHLWAKAVEGFKEQRDAALKSSMEDVVTTKNAAPKRSGKKKKRK